MSTLQLTTTEEAQNFEKSIDIPKKKVRYQLMIHFIGKYCCRRINIETYLIINSIGDYTH